MDLDSYFPFLVPLLVVDAVTATAAEHFQELCRYVLPVCKEQWLPIQYALF